MDHEIMRNRDIYFAWKSSTLSAFPFLTLRVILPLGLLGVFLLSKKIKANWELYALLLLLLLPPIVFFVTSRYRLPSIAIWSIFGGLAIGRMTELMTGKNWRSILFCLCFLVVTATLVSRTTFVVENDPSRKYYNLGKVFLAQNKTGKAIESYHKALPLMEETTENKKLKKAEVYYSLGAAYQNQGNISQALNYYNRAIELVPDYGRVFLTKCEVYLKQKNYASAFDTIIEAMEKESLFHRISEREKAYELLANTLYHAQPSDQRIGELVNRFKIGKLQAVFLNYMGEQRLEQGQYGEAKKLFQVVLKLDPTNQRAILNLSNVEMKLDNPISAE
jgi:Tfp pilus assembly protein PilF